MSDTKTAEEMKLILERRSLKAKARVDLDTMLARWMQVDGLTLPESIDVLREALRGHVDWLAQEFEAGEREVLSLRLRLRQADLLCENLTRALDQVKQGPQHEPQDKP